MKRLYLHTKQAKCTACFSWNATQAELIG